LWKLNNTFNNVSVLSVIITFFLWSYGVILWASMGILWYWKLFELKIATYIITIFTSYPVAFTVVQAIMTLILYCCCFSIFISNCYARFSFDLMEGYFQYQQNDSDNENYRSVWHCTHYGVTDKSNNVSFEALNKHYHSSSVRLAVILVIMSVSTFITAVILYIIAVWLLVNYTGTRRLDPPFPGWPPPFSTKFNFTKFIFFP